MKRRQFIKTLGANERHKRDSRNSSASMAGGRASALSWHTAPSLKTGYSHSLYPASYSEKISADASGKSVRDIRQGDIITYNGARFLESRLR